MFCLRVPKNFVGEPFCDVFQKNSGSEKVYGKEGEEYQEFPSKIFCLTVPKNFVGEPFCDMFQKNSGSGKGGEHERVSAESFLSHSAKNFCRGTL